MTSITQGSSTVSFAYDALGRRISRTTCGVTTQLLSDPSGRVWLEAQGQTLTAAYTYGNALVRKDGEYPLFDGLGSERTVTNGSQSVTGSITCEAFGQTIATSGSSANPYKFAATSGYRDDGDAGLLHVGARYYDPQVGQFLTRDTYLDQHPYLYCEHDPVNAVDPSGHDYDWIKELIDFSTPKTAAQRGFAGGAAVVGIGGSIGYITGPDPGDLNNNLVGVGSGVVGIVGGIGAISGAAGAVGAGGMISVGGAVLVGTGVGAIAIGAIAIGVGVYRLGHYFNWWK